MSDGLWRTFGQRRVYDSPWVNVDLVDVQEPEGRRFEHHAIRMRDVAIIGLVRDEHVLLAWRHRFIPNTWSWELPGGIVDDGETPAQAAAREAEEETGWRPETVERLLTFEPMPGIAATPHHIFIGHNPSQVSDGQLAECVKSEWTPINALPALLAEGTVSDASAIIGLQQLHMRRDELTGL